MPDVLTDKKITQDEANRLMAPMELDLTALMKVIEQDIITGLDGYEGTPEQYIEEVLNNLQGPGETGEIAVIKDDKGLVSQVGNMAKKVKKMVDMRKKT